MPVTVQQQGEIHLYANFFKFLPLHKESINGIDIFKPAPSIDMFLLHQHYRSNCIHMGDIVHLTDVQEIMQLVPIFGHNMGYLYR